MRFLPQKMKKCQQNVTKIGEILIIEVIGIKCRLNHAFWYNYIQVALFSSMFFNVTRCGWIIQIQIFSLLFSEGSYKHIPPKFWNQNSVCYNVLNTITFSIFKHYIPLLGLSKHIIFSKIKNNFNNFKSW